jgi:N-acetyl-gamma-glutamyl-phosphate reductase
MKKIKAGIIGGAGYTGGELIRLLIHHPHVEIAFVQSSSHAGKPLFDAHTDLLGETHLLFSATIEQEADVLFLCSGHNAAKKFLAENNVSDNTVIIDLSQDFRHQANCKAGNRKFIYGLPELNREIITTAKSIANPGCFATCIELALLPAASNHMLRGDIHINAITGSTGAGQSLSETSHFSWRFGNASVYKAFEHQHLQEIGETLATLQTNFNATLNFIPQRGSFTRGILASVYFNSEKSLSELLELYKSFYNSHPFVHISTQSLDVKQVVNTNKCFIHIEKHGDKVLITSVIDNLLKGASGQAVQNMNLIFGFDEKAGLQLKPSAF